jgi:competence protein ComEC
MNRPVFFLAVALAAGIAAAQITGVHYIAALILLTAGAAAHFAFGKKTDKTIFLVFFLLGGLLYSFQNTYISVNSIRSFDIKGIKSVKVIVGDDPEQSGSKIYFYGRLLSVYTAAGESTGVTGKIRVTLEKTIAPPPKYGDILIVKGKLREPEPPKNPGEFDYKKYLAFKQVYFTLYARDTAVEKQGQSIGNYFKYFSYKCKEKLLSIIYTSLPDAEARVLDGLMLGNQRAIPDDVYDEFKITGTVHILAVSGMNVGMIALFAFFFLKLAGVNRKIAAAATMVLVVSFMVITGAGGSIVRSTLMSCMVLLAVILERDVDAFNSISVAAFAILFFNPSELYDVGFVMSFCAAFGIIYSLEWVNKSLPKIHPWIKEPLATTVAAQLFLTPVMADTFHQVSIIAVLANLAIVPLSGTISIIGYAMWLTGVFFMRAAGVFGAAAWALIKVMLLITHLAAQAPYAAISVKTLPVLFTLIYYIFFITLPHGDIDLKIKNMSLKSAAGIILAFWAVFHIVVPSNPALTCPAFRGLNAAFIQAPGNKKILVIKGADIKPGTAVRSSMVPFLRSLGINNIDSLVLYTIPAKESIPLFMNFRVKHVYCDAQSKTGFSGEETINGSSYYKEGNDAFMDLSPDMAEITVKEADFVFVNYTETGLLSRQGAVIYLPQSGSNMAGVLSKKNRVIINSLNNGFFRKPPAIAGENIFDTGRTGQYKMEL